jgi:hypothetical protein
MPLMFGTSVSYTSDLSIKNCGSLDVITQRGQGGSWKWSVWASRRPKLINYPIGWAHNRPLQ